MNLAHRPKLFIKRLPYVFIKWLVGWAGCIQEVCSCMIVHVPLRIRYWKNSIPVLKKNQVQYYWKSSGSEAWNSIPWSILILVWYWFGIDPDIGLILIAISIWYWLGYGLARSNFDFEFIVQKSFASILQRVHSAKLVLQRVHSEFTAQNLVYSEFTAQN